MAAVAVAAPLQAISSAVVWSDVAAVPPGRPRHHAGATAGGRHSSECGRWEGGRAWVGDGLCVCGGGGGRVAGQAVECGCMQL